MVTGLRSTRVTWANCLCKTVGSSPSLAYALDAAYVPGGAIDGGVAALAEGADLTRAAAVDVGFVTILPAVGAPVGDAHLRRRVARVGLAAGVVRAWVADEADRRARLAVRQARVGARVT